MSQTPDSVSRREFISRAAIAGVALSAPVFLVACGDGAPTSAAGCDGYAALSPEEIQARQTLQYVDQSSVAAKNCANCLQYNAPEASGACGGCKMFAGPVLPSGYCAVWAAQPV